MEWIDHVPADTKDVIIRALADAYWYRQVDRSCGYCGLDSPEQLCEDHQHDQEMADEYGDLVQDMGGTIM